MTNAVAVRDRVLAYLTGLDLGGLPSLELAAECLRRAGPDAGVAEAMRVLRAMLEERGIGGRADERVRSFPPHRRRVMLSAPLRRRSKRGA